VQPQEAMMKKDVESKVAAKKWCDGRLMAKNFNVVRQFRWICVAFSLCCTGI